MKNFSWLLALLIVVSCKDTTEKVVVEKETNLINFQQVKDIELFAGSLFRVDAFPSKYVTPRPVDVWLPKDYSEETEYSVLYMHDGQMLFDSTTTWNKQEWKVDEWASKLMNDNKTDDFIVVAVHNISDLRWEDLFPQKAFDFVEKGQRDSVPDIAGRKNFKLNGDNYLKFIVEEIKPILDLSYSVKTDRVHTFVMGSSMGGLMSMYAISEYPEVFGGAACLSTHWVGAMPMPENPFPDGIFKYMTSSLPEAGSHKLYFDYGNKTLDAHYPQYAPNVDEVLKEKGYSNVDSKNLFFDGTDHSENSWNQRLDQPLIFLLDNN